MGTETRMPEARIPEADVFVDSVQTILERRIRASAEAIKARALDELKESIEEHVTRLIVSIFNVVSFERPGNELLIKVDLKGIKDFKEAKEG